MTYRHILFDIDGTLIDTEQMLITVFSDVLRRRYRYELTIDMFRSTFGLPCDVALRAIGLEPRQSVMDEIQQGIRRSLHLARLFPGIGELIPTLHATGLTLGLVTSKSRQEFQSSFVPFGLAPYFSLSVCSDDTPRGKPYPDPILYYMAQQDAAPKETVYIGDTAFDCQCAERAGVDFILAAWGGVSPDMASYSPAAKSPAHLQKLLTGRGCAATGSDSV